MSTAAEELREEDALASDAPAPGGAAAAELPVTIIEHRPGWRVIDLGELWRYRELLGFLVWRDVKVRYKQTVLGAAWAVLQPLLMMVVFTIFFGRLAKVSSADWPYPVFAYAGLLPWTFFATAITSAGNSVIGSEQLITKVYFPRLAIPFAAVGAAVVDFAIASVLLGALMAGYGVSPGAGAWLAPLVFLLILLAALGIGTFLAALNVAYRDFKYVIPFLTQVWMFATPTVYMEPQDVPPLFLVLNPMTPLIAAFRAAVLGRPIAAGPLALASAVILALFLGGCSYFRRSEASFADII